MRSRLLTGTKEIAQAFGRWCERTENIRIVTAWATTDCMACEFLEKARSKISTMVVGLDFYTTSPSFLESFLSVTHRQSAAGWNISSEALFVRNRRPVRLRHGQLEFHTRGVWR
jgi:hypothetical protein